MKPMKVLIGILLILTVSGVAFSADMESLAKGGYQVVEQTKVVGQFKGCDATTALTLSNGKVFVCSTYSYSFAIFMPDAVIFQNKNKDIKILINGTAYSGSFVEQGK